MLIMVCSLLAYLFLCVDWRRQAEVAQAQASAGSKSSTLPAPASTQLGEPPKSIVGKSSYKRVAEDEVQCAAGKPAPAPPKLVSGKSSYKRVAEDEAPAALAAPATDTKAGHAEEGERLGLPGEPLDAAIP